MDPTENPELVRIFLEEARAHIEAIRRQPGPVRLRALHSLKGVTGMMGFDAAHRLLTAADAAARKGDESLIAGAVAAVEDVVARLDRPRASLGADPAAEIFVAEMAENLDAIDRLLEEAASTVEPEALRRVVDDLFRRLHTIKGAAPTVGRHALSRASHLLEELLSGVRDGDRALDESMIEQLATCRSLLGAMLNSPERSAELLRVLEGRVASLLGQRGPSPPPDPAPVAPVQFDRRLSVDRRRDPAGTLRVPAVAVDRLLDSTGEMILLRERMGRHGETLERTVRTLARAREGLVKALRQIGPARPWGPPERALRAVADVGSELGAATATLKIETDGVEADAEALRSLADATREELAQMRTLPAQRLFDRTLPAVDEFARRSGKRVRFETTGGEVEIDRGSVDRLFDPLMQLLRNAVAHGIETPEERIASGKSDTGTIRLDALVRADRVLLRVRDDGAGIAVEAVRERAIELGLLSPSVAMAASDAEVIDTLFSPGFTSRSAPTELAGRGVGLDLVQSTVESLGGSVRVEHVPGAGATFELRIPARVTVLRALLVGCGAERFAIPASVVRSAVRIGDGRTVNGNWQGPEGKFPYLSLAVILKLTERTERPIGVIVDSDLGPFVLDVGVAIGEEEVVVRSLPPLLAGLSPYAGAAVGADGRVTLLIDVDAVRGKRISTPPPALARILLVDDSATIRAAVGKLLASAGYDVQTATNGREALEALDQGPFHAVVSDIEMPEIDGIELLARIRRDPKLQRLPFVVLTAKGSLALIERCERYGVSGVVDKAVPRQRLLRIIAAALSGHT